MRNLSRVTFVAAAIFALATTSAWAAHGGGEAAHGAGPHGPGVSISELGLRINGYFDVAFERRGYSDDPTDGHSAFENYHHFVFLTRSGDDPFFFTAEIIDLTFYEFGAKWKGEDWSLSGKAGKVLVPFGAEPLFHHSYGGLSGFDQEILPTVWARYGGVLTGRLDLGDVQLTNDLYGVNGYELDAVDDVIDLQNDFALDDEARPAVGNRLAVGWGPFSGWYSIYYNTLGVHRRLLMQAVDVSLWKPEGVPVLQNMSITAGAMRADVSGDGEDYYHFGSYIEARYYATDYLYLQYRTGIRTEDNRDGFYADDDREDEKDGSVHNVGVVYTRDGFTAGLYHVWNLEDANEQDDDFLRLRLAYAF